MVGREGLEPSKPEARDLQSLGFDHSPTSPRKNNKMDGVEGFEPSNASTKS